MSQKFKDYILVTFICEVLVFLINWFILKSEFRGSELHFGLIWFNILWIPIVSLGVFLLQKD